MRFTSSLCAGLLCFSLCSPAPSWGAAHENRADYSAARATNNLAPLAQNKEDAKAAHALYEKAMKKKDAAERFKMLHEGVTRHPRSAELRYGLGREYHQRARLDSALVHFEAVMNLDAELARQTDLASFMPQAYVALATQAFKHGRFSEALRGAQNALRYEANNVPALNVAALASYQLKQYEPAVDYGKQLLTLQPFAQNYNNLAAAYEAQSDLPSALQNYKHAVALDPALAEAQKNLQRVQTRIDELSASTAPKEAAPKNPAKNKTSVRPKPEPKPKPNATAKASPPSKPPTPAALAKNFPPQFPQAKFKIGPPRARKPVMKIVMLPPLSATPAPAPPVAWNRAQYAESGWWAATVWLLALFGLVLIAWKIVKREQWQRLLRLAKKIFASKKIARAPRAPQPQPLTAISMNADDARMLRRAVEEASPLLMAKASAATAPIAPSASLPLLAPERARATAIVPVSQPPVQPQIGLQTEMFFAEMIAAAPEAFESTTVLPLEDEARVNGKSNGAASKGLDSSRANGALDHEPPSNSAQSAPPDDDDATLFPAHDAPGFSQTPPAFASPVIAALFEEQSAAPPEISTPKFESRATNDISGKTPSPTITTSPHTATRTMEISALAAQHIGRYVAEKELAQGTTGKIYKAWDPKLDRVVVLKTVQYGLSTSPAEIAALKDRIYREARAIAKLSHPNIVIVYDVDDQPEFSYLVMEYLEGLDLKQVLEREHRLDCRRALEIAAQVCNAMEYAHHAGVFHRDLKPSNIMLLDKAEVKVMDFGIAKISNYLSLTQTGRVLGTPSYMAPEQIEGHVTDGRADLFSLGVVLYELLAGKRPFVADSLAALAYKIVHKTHVPPSLVNVELPLELDEVIHRALAKRPEERYQSAAELREALVEIKAKLG